MRDESGLINEYVDVTGLAFSPDSRYLAVGVGEHGSPVHVWDCETRKRTKSFEVDNQSYIYSITFSPDDLWLAASSVDKVSKLYIWNLKRETQIINSDTPEYPCLRFAPDSKLLAAGNEGGVQIYNTQTWTVQSRIEGVLDWATALAWSPDGNCLAIGDYGGRVQVWNLRTKNQTVIFDEADWAIEDVRFLSNSTLLITNGSYVLQVDLPESTIHQLVKIDGFCLRFSDDGQFAAFFFKESNEVRIMSLKSGYSSRVVGVTEDIMHHTAFCPDKRRLAVGCSGDSLYLWDIHDLIKSIS